MAKSWPPLHREPTAQGGSPDSTQEKDSLFFRSQAGEGMGPTRECAAQEEGCEEILLASLVVWVGQVAS